MLARVSCQCDKLFEFVSLSAAEMLSKKCQHENVMDRT